jgi:uncharacterized membrane protein
MSKMKFQVERIALFSDAVFAIAVTLMIIEVHAPHLPHGADFRTAIFAVLKLMPSFIGVALSFFFIGVFWMRHHQMMKYLDAYTPALLRWNLVFLLSIAFIPFSTAFVFENVDSGSPIPLVIYNLNYIVASLFNYRLFTYVINPSNGVRTTEIDEDITELKAKLIFPVFVYIFVAVLAFFTPIAAAGYAAFGLAKFFIKKKKAESIDKAE